MNLFRLAGDMSHLASFLVLLLKLLASRSAAGASVCASLEASKSSLVIDSIQAFRSSPRSCSSWCSSLAMWTYSRTT